MQSDKGIFNNEKSVISIQVENCLKIWKDQFKNLVSANKNVDQDQFNYVNLFDINSETSTAEFSANEIEDSLKTMKPIYPLVLVVLEVLKLKKISSLTLARPKQRTSISV